jgi:hypothetical protein
MIKYLKYDEINKKKWDACIKESFNGLIYGYSWYLDIVAEDWDALVEGDYDRILPLPSRRKYAISYLYQPFFTQQLGVFSKNILTEEITEDFIKSIPPIYRFAEINLNIYNKLDPDKYDIRWMLNHELDLIKPYKDLYSNFSKNIKRNLKKAKNNQVEILKNIRPDEIIEVFKQNKGKEIRVLNDLDYVRLKRIIYTCLYKGKAKIYGAYTPENELCAGAVFTFSHNKATFLFSATNEVAKELGAMPLLIDHFIKEHAQTHLTLDFEGSNDPNLARFYKSFNANEIFYPHLKIDRLPWLVRPVVKLVKKFRSII